GPASFAPLGSAHEVLRRAILRHGTRRVAAAFARCAPALVPGWHGLAQCHAWRARAPALSRLHGREIALFRRRRDGGDDAEAEGRRRAEMKVEARPYNSPAFR